MSKKKQKFGHSRTIDNDEDNVDLETLQARIDMSMSYAQDLVSSWIEPNKVATTSRSHDLEKELKEYMKRPPRLGVGASLPEQNNTSKEGARLKGLLRDKMKAKRSFDEVDKKECDSDDEESKVGVIKKKTKFDPFAMSRSNQKSNLKDHPSWRAVLASEKNSKESLKESLSLGCEVTGKRGPVNPAVLAGLKGVNSMDETAANLPAPDTPDLVTQDGTARVRPPSNNLQFPFTSPSKIAVLNLDGPPPSEDERIPIQADSQSRKRKRRKRKKKNILNQEDERQGDTDVDIPPLTDSRDHPRGGEIHPIYDAGTQGQNA